MTNHTTTSLSCTRIKEEFSLNETTHYGGANLLLDYTLDKLKLPAVFGRNLTIAKNYNAKYPLTDILTNYVVANILGSGRIYHMEPCPISDQRSSAIFGFSIDPNSRKVAYS